MFPPDNFMPEPEFKGVNHLPGCSLQRVIQDVFALPIRVSYDIARVSQTIKRLSEPSLRAYEPKDDFQSPFSSRLAIAICNEISTNLTIPARTSSEHSRSYYSNARCCRLD